MTKHEYIVAMSADLRRQRNALGLSQAVVAKAGGVSASSIVGWEKGTGIPSSYSLARIKAFFKQEWTRREQEAVQEVQA